MNCRMITFLAAVAAFSSVAVVSSHAGTASDTDSLNNHVPPLPVMTDEMQQPVILPEDPWESSDKPFLPLIPELFREPAEYQPSFQRLTWIDQTKEAYHWVRDLVGGRLHVGIRSMHYTFDQNMSRVGEDWDDYFVGSINELQDIQDTSWKNFTYGIYPIRNFGIEYRSDEVRAKTFTDSDDNHSDGDFVVKGDVFAAVARLPLDQILHGVRYLFKWPPHDRGREYDFLGRFVPYIGIGFDRLKGSFEADTWWANGYSSPAAWEALGSPTDTLYKQHFRELRVKDDIGRYRLYGLSVRLIDNLYIDVNWSKVKADIEVDFYLAGRYRSSGNVPMDYSSRRIGVRYFF